MSCIDPDLNYARKRYKEAAKEIINLLENKYNLLMQDVKCSDEKPPKILNWWNEGTKKRRDNIYKFVEKLFQERSDL
jgi:hypothetical protein